MPQEVKTNKELTFYKMNSYITAVSSWAHFALRTRPVKGHKKASPQSHLQTAASLSVLSGTALFSLFYSVIKPCIPIWVQLPFIIQLVFIFRKHSSHSLIAEGRGRLGVAQGQSALSLSLNRVELRPLKMQRPVLLKEEFLIPLNSD
jgi:hypothetical protein